MASLVKNFLPEKDEQFELLDKLYRIAFYEMSVNSRNREHNLDQINTHILNLIKNIPELDINNKYRLNPTDKDIKAIKKFINEVFEKLPANFKERGYSPRDNLSASK